MVRERLAGAGQQMSSKASAGALRGLDASAVTVRLTESPREKVAESALKFGQTISDHMLRCRWSVEGGGWGAPEIVPAAPFEVHPFASVLHYANTCFEGMKAFVGSDGQVRLFRPERNMARLNGSCARHGLPAFEGSELVALIKKLLLVDKAWVPKSKGCSMYLRPLAFGATPALGLAAQTSTELLVMMSPVARYFAGGAVPVKLLVDSRVVRAWPGGHGDAKLGGNYGPTVPAQQAAMAQGFSQNLFVLEDPSKPGELLVGEAGTMNFFAVWRKKGAAGEGDAEVEAVTPNLDGTILPGVTRASAIELLRDHFKVDVQERPLYLSELVDAAAEGRLLECFGTGTAAIVQPVSHIQHGDGKILQAKRFCATPDSEEFKASLGMRLMDTILDIQHGDMPYKDWSQVVG